MRDRPQSGSRQATQCANSDKYRGEFRGLGITIAQSIGVALVLMQLGLSQTLFDVRNPKNQKWPEADANRVYMSTARVIAAEFKLSQPIYAHFTLILGADENSVDIDARELRLKKWDTYFYAEGVLRLGFDQVMSSEAKMRLARRAVAESKATVTVDQARTASTPSPPGSGRVESNSDRGSGAHCVHSQPAVLSESMATKPFAWMGAVLEALSMSSVSL